MMLSLLRSRLLQRSREVSLKIARLSVPVPAKLVVDGQTMYKAEECTAYNRDKVEE